MVHAGGCVAPRETGTRPPSQVVPCPCRKPGPLQLAGAKFWCYDHGAIAMGRRQCEPSDASAAGSFGLADEKSTRRSRQ